MKRAPVTLLLTTLPLLLPSLQADTSLFTVDQSPQAVTVRNQTGAPVLVYQLEKPAGSTLSVDSACYFHPLATPRGMTLTDVAPSDHLHHRGIFLAWVEMHGDEDADFWGWGEHAPTQDRVIVNREVKVRRGDQASPKARFEARNHWVAESAMVLEETMRAEMTMIEGVHVLDLQYQLRPGSDLTLSQWAFSGFCVRARKGGQGQYLNENGPVSRPAPIHTQPESNWPASAWYALDVRYEGGEQGGVAVIDHPLNPPATWHNHPDLRMLNPAITAPGEVRLKKNRSTRLRYRVVAYDGPAPVALLRRLAADWGR